MVEFAFVLPVMLLLMVMIVDFGRAFYSYVNLTNAAREGARKAIVCQNTTSIQTRVINSAPGLGLSAGGVSISAGPYTIGNAITVTATYPYTTVTPLTNLVNLASSGGTSGGPLTFTFTSATSMLVERVTTAC